mmetsp:Transcript_5688/g.14661  ORF Transcript_5688/g.14661 Transcript_5688/m.14661 type:complete len:242 (-) Transcript_5688:212-937(-)
MAWRGSPGKRKLNRALSSLSLDRIRSSNSFPCLATAFAVFTITLSSSLLQHPEFSASASAALTVSSPPWRRSSSPSLRLSSKSALPSAESTSHLNTGCNVSSGKMKLRLGLCACFTRRMISICEAEPCRRKIRAVWSIIFWALEGISAGMRSRNSSGKASRCITKGIDEADSLSVPRPDGSPGRPDSSSLGGRSRYRSYSRAFSRSSCSSCRSCRWTDDDWSAKGVCALRTLHPPTRFLTS